MAKQNKMMLPILLGGGLLAVLMMGGKKAKAASAPKPGTGELPESGGIQVEPIPAPAPAPKPATVGPVTNLEKQNALIVINEASLVSNLFPNNYGDKKEGQSDLDWATNMIFWLTYSYPKSYQPQDPKITFSSAFYGGDPVPYKLSKDMAKVDGKGYEYWSKVWTRIRTYIKAQYPEIFK